jgi:hypothetical protein
MKLVSNYCGVEVITMYNSEWNEVQAFKSMRCHFVCFSVPRTQNIFGWRYIFRLFLHLSVTKISVKSFCLGSLVLFGTGVYLYILTRKRDLRRIYLSNQRNSKHI